MRAVRAMRARRPRRGTVCLAVLSVGASLLASLAATPSGAATAADPSDLAPASFSTGVRTYVAVGDSITAGMVQATDSLSAPGATSWLNGETAARLQRVGGWAYPGTTTADMRAGFVRTPADVLVLLAGTNDLARGIPWEVTEANLVAIAAQAGTRNLLLVAIPPSDANPPARTAFNARLAALAGRAQWRFVDPWTGVAVDGAWAPGTTVEGIHPTPEIAAAAGRVITDRAWQAAATRTGR